MSKNRWNLIVTGEVIEGFSPEEVMESFQRLSRLSPERIEDLFRNGKALCRRNLDDERARLQLEILRRKGLVCHLRERRDNGRGRSPQRKGRNQLPQR